MLPFATRFVDHRWLDTAPARRHCDDVNEPERTPDGRYIVVGARRWRASDPGIPGTLRQELVDELMAARRLVRTDPETARPRVQDAKVALGERGYAWWETPTDEERDARIEATIRALLRHRDGKTICPSDVARVVGGEETSETKGEVWRDLMPAVRAVAHRMRTDGEVRVTQKGVDVDESARGPVSIAPVDDESAPGTSG